MLGNNYEKFTPEWVPVEGACSKCGAPILRNTVAILQTPTGNKYWVKCSSTKCAHMEKHPPEAPIQEQPKQELLLEESPIEALPIEEIPLVNAPIEVAPIEPASVVTTIEEPIIEAAHTIEEEPIKEATIEPTPEVAPIKQPSKKKGTSK